MIKLPFLRFLIGILWVACYGASAWAQKIPNCNSSIIGVSNSSFESPNIAYGNFQYRPSGASWTFSNGAGISDNRSGFTGGNPQNAPIGSQVLFLQNQGYAQVTINVPTEGAYRVRLQAAQRAWFNSGQGQTVRVLLDGATVQDIAPTNTSYRNYNTAIWWLSAGSHTLRLAGTASVGDQTAFVDDVKLEKLPTWSQNSSWQDGTKPNVGDMVLIPQNCTMVLDNNVGNAAALIHVKGTLTAALNGNFRLATQGIHVMNGGALLVGSKEAPYIAQGSITLTGAGGANPGSGMGYKVIGAMSGGTVELHGQPKKSWTQLRTTAYAGRNYIEVEATTGWKVGDRIVIASTDFDMDNAEERTITQINGSRVYLSTRLNHKHFGQKQTYQRVINRQTHRWILDERAEVGMLSRNLVIQGDISSASTKFGGHIMMMRGSTARISNVELYRMGQRNILGRYPFHWHLMGDASGQYFSNSSVHHTYNRAITVHGTNNTVVDQNVCYDNLGHAVFLEDGNETGNQIIGNLGLVTRRPHKDFALLHSDVLKHRNASGPSTFWITHPHNTVQNNRAAGSDGSGFWFAFHAEGNGLNFANGAFDNNTAHSSYHGWLVGMGPDRDDSVQLTLTYEPSTEVTINNLTVYKNQLGNYSRIKGRNRTTNKTITNTYNNMIVADNWEGETSTWKTNYNRVLWVGASDNHEHVSNIPDRLAPSERGDKYVVGHIIYDGPVHIKDSYFADFDAKYVGGKLSKFSLFDQWGATIRYMGHTMENTIVDKPSSYQVHFREVQDHNGTDLQSFWFAGMIYDIDGAMTNQPMNAITRNTPIMVDGTSLPIGSGNASEVTRRFAYVELRSSDEDYGPASKRRQTSTLTRGDGVSFTELHQHSALDGVALPIMVDGVHHYKYTYSKPVIPTISRFDFHSMNQGEYVILEVANVPSGFIVRRVTPRGKYSYYANDGLQLVPNRLSLANLKSMNGSGYYYNSFTKSLYLRYQALSGSFTDDGIIESLMVCTNGTCNGTVARTHTVVGNDQSESNSVVYPNPFEHTLQLSVKVANNEKVTFKLYDLLGKERKNYVQSNLKAGKHRLEVNVADLPKGSYLYRLQVGNKYFTGKLLKK
ncbi:G8 domain-containing protein [Microscilla marina]|uniref:Tmem2 protein n=1 Tax=Microscilla marina ATCC 23134 TaxID=313606 RepID=A1ZC97_MICM2|nr:G8 domain-containing protein [Microscilla marina]EAY31898.1 tmem2 protein [Microscilla marina ATCC 23134]